MVFRDPQSLKLLREIRCDHTISNIVWSPHSEKLLLQFQKTGEIWIWSFVEKKWIAEIRMDPEIARVPTWSPKGDAILSTCSIGTNLAIWPLDGTNPILIEAVKGPSKGIKFSNNGKYLAVAYRKGFEDTIQIISTNDWSVVHEFSTGTENLEDFIWSADDRFFICWDTPCNFKLEVFSMEGSMVKSVDTERCAMGIRSLAISPSQKLLSVGSYDECLRFWNTLTWEFITEIEHLLVIDTEETQIFIEDSFEVGFHTNRKQSTYSIGEIPFSIETKKTTNNQENQKSMTGTKILKWSPCGSFFVSQLEELPNLLWVWDKSSWSLISVIENDRAIVCAEWCPEPSTPILSFCCNSGHVYFWTPETCSIIDIPKRKFAAKLLRWNADGSSCAVIDKNSFFLCYLPADEYEEEEEVEEEDEDEEEE